MVIRYTDFQICCMAIIMLTNTIDNIPVGEIRYKIPQLKYDNRAIPLNIINVLTPRFNSYLNECFDAIAVISLNIQNIYPNRYAGVSIL